MKRKETPQNITEEEQEGFCIEEEVTQCLKKAKMPIIEDDSTYADDIANNCMKHFMQCKEWLRSTENNFLQIRKTKRTDLISNLTNFKKDLEMFLELCNSAELLLIENDNPHLSKLELPEVLAIVFSYLSFEDYIKVYRVCKLWNRACVDFSYSLSSFDITNKMNFEMIDMFEIYQKFILNRNQYIKSVSNLNGSLIDYFKRHSILFPNANYNSEGQVYFEIPPIHDIKAVFQRSRLNEDDSSSTLTLHELISDKRIRDLNQDKIKKLSVNCNYLFFKEKLKLNNLEEIKFHKFPGNFFDRVEWGSSCSHLIIAENVNDLSTSEFIEQITSVATNDLGNELLPNLTSFTSTSYPIKDYDLEAFVPKLKHLELDTCISRSYNIKALNNLVNVEKLCIAHKLISKLDFSKLCCLTDLKITGKSNQNFNISLNNLKILHLESYDDITVDCPNLLSCNLTKRLTSNVVRIISKKLLHLKLERDIKVLSIKGPCVLQKVDFLTRVVSVIDLECPLIYNLRISNLVGLSQSASLRTVILKQLKILKLHQASFILFDYETSIEHLEIMGWRDTLEVTKESIQNYSKNIKSFKKLYLENCSSKMVEIINDIFHQSESLVELKVRNVPYTNNLFKSIESKEYPNLKVLHLDAISSLSKVRVDSLVKCLSKRNGIEELSLILSKDSIFYKHNNKFRVPKNLIHFRTSVTTFEAKGCKNLKRLFIVTPHCNPLYFDQSNNFKSLLKFGKKSKNVEYISIGLIDPPKVKELVDRFNNLKLLHLKGSVLEIDELEKNFPNITITHSRSNFNNFF
ncbi:hypothetical protein ABK040_006005 [Willaertia magna]